MTKTRMAALLAALGLPAAGRGADDPDADSGSAQADGGGCADHTRTDDAAWRPARYAQDDDWQPPAEPVAVGEGLDRGRTRTGGRVARSTCGSRPRRGRST